MNPIVRHIIRITALVVLASAIVSCAKRREPIQPPDTSSVLSFFDGKEIEHKDLLVTLSEDLLSALEITESGYLATGGGGSATIAFTCEDDNGTYRISGTLIYDLTNGAIIGKFFECDEIVETE